MFTAFLYFRALWTMTLVRKLESVFFPMNRFQETDTVARSYYGNSHVSKLIHAIQYEVIHGLNCVVFL